MRIGIPISKYAYTPESFAYQKYLAKLGHDVELDYILSPDNDVNIYYMGFRPFWKSNSNKAIEIHEYQSLSLAPFSKTKNNLKRLVNRKPNGRIFLNEKVRSDLKFDNKTPYLYRDMGVDNIFFQEPSRTPFYDIIYCGSFTGRPGLIDVIQSLSTLYRIVIIGKLTNKEEFFLQHPNITLLGPLPHHDIPAVLREARYGLNYTPDIYPFNIQTSTKTIEYLAAGLHVISNKYDWSERFFNEINYEPLWIEDINNDKISNHLVNGLHIDKSIMEEYEWNNLLKSASFEKFILDVCNT